MRNSIIIAALLTLGFTQTQSIALAGGTPKPPSHDSAQREVAAVNGSVFLGRGIEAHGGLANWKAKGTLAYTLRDFPLTPALSKPNRSTVDLVSRFNHIQSDGFVAAWDGVDAWISPTADAAGLPPRFFVRGTMYFLMMPFVFADAGITAKDSGTKTFKGETFDLVTISYAAGVGDVDDGYELLFDRGTHKLRAINHSVKGAGIDRVTWEFNSWQTVNGLQVPKVMTFYPGWNADNPGEGKPVQVENVKLESARPSQKLFTDRPLNAVVPE